MAGSSTVRWRTAAAVTAALTAMALVACGKGANAPDPTGTSDAEVGGAPTATTPAASPSAGASPTRPGSGAPVYPKDAKAYSQELLKAWAGPDYPRLGQLAEPSAVQQIRDSVTFGGKPNSQWTYIRCGQGEQSGTTECVFRNAHGDETKITLATAKLGSPTAVTAVPLERTEYPDDPGSYVGVLLSALDDGNQQRVLRLSNSTVRGGLTCKISARITGWEAIDSTYTKVTVVGQGGDSGKEYVFKVLSQPGGKAGAIKEILDKQNC